MDRENDEAITSANVLVQFVSSNILDKKGRREIDMTAGGEAWLFNAHISPFEKAGGYFNHDPRRTRKLLLHREQINKLLGQVEQKGLTLVPLKMYLKNGRVKVDIAVGRGKKLHDKRDDIRQRDDKRTMERAMKRY